MNRPEPGSLRALRLSLAALWLWTAGVSAWEWQGQSLALLDNLPARWAAYKPALIGSGIVADATIGLWLWLSPGRAAYAAALAAMLGMTGLATLIEPGWWLHPFGPLSKNLPIAAALVLLWHHENGP